MQPFRGVGPKSRVGVRFAGSPFFGGLGLEDQGVPFLPDEMLGDGSGDGEQPDLKSLIGNIPRLSGAVAEPATDQPSDSQASPQEQPDALPPVTDPTLSSRQQLAQAMLARGLSGAPTSKWGALANVGSALAGAYLTDKFGEEQKTAATAKRKDLHDAMMRAGMTPAQLAALDRLPPDQAATVAATYEFRKPEKPQETIEDQIRLFDATKGKEAAARTRLLNTQADAGGYRPPSGSGPGGSRPLPASIQKLEDEDISAIQTVQTINGQLKNFQEMINPTQQPGQAKPPSQLELGPVNNFLGGIQNAAGMSTPNSRNLATFQSTLEKMRNDSLILNKGVQTEGDAQRAWNALIANINDPGVVNAQLTRIQELNATAAQQKLQQINIRRQRNGQPAFDPGEIGFPGIGGQTPGTGGQQQGGGVTQEYVPGGPLAGGPVAPPAPPPKGAIDMLRQNRALASQFDQKYGPGAAARALGGK